MRIVINDANILIDLAKLELIETFSRLNFDLHTTDFIIEELNEEQLIPVNQLIKSGKLTVIETEEIQDFQAITDILSTSNGLSFEDCSVWYYSKKLSGALLTGDGKLRKQASKDVEVRGIIFIFDELLKQNLLTFSVAIEKITILYQLNNRLPKKILDDRLQLWREEKHVG
ncbi:PIN domain-containing protein [Salinimicrobium oceani]|uniref:PIN domain-containing protein n=1 Tax=Salinimicrobium oceani TaxID=2722702 RepID=A0ABX1CVB1_9FLAO|nr:PIN domain-containing protein [Salinimicrobium oceani]NJW52219.1 PIN domain-containing protein [Salinimicrobium oceani]